MAVQLCDCTKKKNKQTLNCYFKCINDKVCELYLNKPIIDDLEEWDGGWEEVSRGRGYMYTYR